VQVLLAERFARRTSPFTLRDGLLLLLPRRCNGLIVVRSRLGTTSDVSGHCFHHRCFAASVELAWGSCSAQLT